MLTDSGPLFLSDTTLNIDPSDTELAKITILNAELVKLLGFKSVIALLSFSNFGTSDHPNAKKVSKAVSYLHKKHPEIDVDGPLQSDFALNRKMLKENFLFLN